MQHLEIMLRLVRNNVATMGTVTRTVYIAGVITDHWGFFYVMRSLSGGDDDDCSDSGLKAPNSNSLQMDTALVMSHVK